MANPAQRWPAVGRNSPTDAFQSHMWDRNASLRQVMAEMATRQHGVVALWQLLELGFARSTVHRWAQSGWLHRIHQGVYAVGHTALSAPGRWMAGVLACGPRSVLSYQPAGSLL